MGEPHLVQGRYPQDFVQEPCRTWVTRSTTDDKVVLSLKESGRYTAHSNGRNWGHGDGFIHLGGLNFAIGTVRHVQPFTVVDIDGDHLRIENGTPYEVSDISRNVMVGNGFGRIAVLEKFTGTNDKRVRTADEAAFFASTKYSDIGSEMFETDWTIDEGAVQGIGFVDANTVVIISGGADVKPRVKTYDALTGAETVHPTIDTSHVNGTHIEAEGFDQGMTMIVYTHTGTGNVRFKETAVLP